MLMDKVANKLVFLFVLLLTGCANVPTTDVNTFDATFNADSADRPLGVIRFDIHQILPMSVGQSVAGQFGMIGAAIWMASQSAANEKDNSVDQVGVRFYRDAFASLRDKLQVMNVIQFTDLDSRLFNDDIELSRHIRDLRLNGSQKPTVDEIKAFCRENGLDYALYGKHWGLELEMDESIIMNSQWSIYNLEGKEVVSVFIRSKKDAEDPGNMDQATVAETLSVLYEENLDKFVMILQNNGKS